MIRLGMLDFDTSHSVEFVKRLNHQQIDCSQWVEGARVVVGCPGESLASPERLPGFTDQIRRMGVPMVDDPAEMIGRVDGMLIESVDGSVHRERTRPFLEAGIPCFVDKPFACGLADAKNIVELAARNHVPIFSSSSLRYAPEVIGYIGEPGHGSIVGSITYGPAHGLERNPGLFHYGIHAIELLYALMGPGCLGVSCLRRDGVDVVTGDWIDGRVGTVRGIRAGKAAFGAVVFAEESVTHLEVGTTDIYRELLKRVVEMFRTGRPPVEPTETLELIAFIEAANRSAGSGGGREPLGFTLAAGR